MTPLEKEIFDEIRNLAINDPATLMAKYLDMDKLKICKRRKMGQTLQQIAIAMGMPKTTVAGKCKKC